MTHSPLTLLIVLTCVFILSHPAYGHNWQKLENGIEHTTTTIETETHPAKLYLFRINPALYRLTIESARKFKHATASIEDFARHNPKALLLINGGFFSIGHQPLGLRVMDGREKNPLKATSWWSVFMIKNREASIIPKAEYTFSTMIEMAIQTGPRLVIDGKIPKLKAGKARRSALGITPDKKIIIAAATDDSISTTQLAEKLARPESMGGFNCMNAINLDGGSSTQLLANIGSFKLLLKGLSPVTDAIAIYKR